MTKLHRDIFTLMVMFISTVVVSNAAPISTIQTPYTVTKVRSIDVDGYREIVASSYDGTIMRINYDGDIIWENRLSGFVNHDIYCEDIDDDGNDEIFAANADGALYCLNADGTERWSFRRNDVPLYAVTVLKNGGDPIIVCGGYDMNIYCISASNNLLQSYHSKTFSVTGAWGDDVPSQKQCTANFLKRVVDATGRELLAIHGVSHNMAGSGTLYLMDVDLTLDEMTLVSKETSLTSNTPIGSMSLFSQDGAADRLLLGTSSMISGSCFVDVTVTGDNGADSDIKTFDISGVKGTNSDNKSIMDNFGYRVAQCEVVAESNPFRYFVLFGSRVILVSRDLKWNEEDVLIGDFSYNDICSDTQANKIILASAQSGGNCIHIIDLDNEDWREAYEQLLPPGNIESILECTGVLNEQLSRFDKPEWERNPLPVYLMSDNLVESPTNSYVSKYASPIFLGNTVIRGTENPDEWSRDTMRNEKYRNIREGRQKYDMTSEECVSMLLKAYDNSPYGGSFWAGHGNDPYYFSPTTLRTVLESEQAKGKMSVLIYPELEDHSADFEYVTSSLIYPLASYARNKNIKLFIRSKDIFWLGSIYTPAWQHLIAGRYPDVFVPSMEETSDRVMELSMAARLGVWASGAVNSWGSRSARDNPSYDRLRQFSHQMLPNHFLRMLVYHVSYGSQYLDNFPVDQEYMSTLWDLIGRGLIYVPKREEVVSFSPLHLTMRDPDEDFLAEGTIGKFTVLYDEDEAQSRDNMVFSRLNATWPGGAVTEWDFSNYAAGVKDRRLNFLPTYPNGMVLIAPTDDPSAPRSTLESHLHPLYRGIVKSYETDGKSYFEGGARRDAKSFYKTVSDQIEELSHKLPITVDGDVAWVAAQSAPKHIRLTLIDGGYINPSDSEVVITFNTVKPVKITDLATGEKRFVSPASRELRLSVPAGLFRFIDIEIEEAL